jgi:hypothetical protein
MQLYDEIESICSGYSIPLTTDTIGYLQLFHNFTSVPNLDINTVKYYAVTKDGTQTQISALNTVAQYLGNNNFNFLAQGFSVPTLQNFRIKVEIKMNSGTIETFYTDLFTFEQCGNSGALIPCLVNGQQYSVNGNFIDEINENIVYQSWQTNEPKKYTPVAFIRNLSFIRKSNTIEYKKLNNKPLRTTLKKDYKIKCEPIPESYIDTINEVFSFGKVNLLDKTYAFDTYNIEVIDENDCCSLYKINATAYEESKLRLLCSNNCTVLSPVDCSDVDYSPYKMTLLLCKRTFEEVGSEVFDITDEFLAETGLDISEIALNTTCPHLSVVGDRVVYTAIEEYESCNFVYEICGVEKTLTIAVSGFKSEETPVISYSEFINGKWVINGIFNDAFEIIYTNLDVIPNEQIIYGVVFEPTNQVVLNIPDGRYKFVARTYCNGIYSDYPCYDGCIYLKSVKLASSVENPDGVTFIYRKCVDSEAVVNDLQIGQVLSIDECVEANAFKVNGNTIGKSDSCFSEQEINDAIAGDGIIYKPISDFSVDPAVLIGFFEFSINDNNCN